MESIETLPPPTNTEHLTQPVLPGLVPAFNFEEAFRSIIEQRVTVRVTEAHARERAEEAKEARKRHEAEQDKLSALEDEYAQRSYQADTEASLSPLERRLRTCAFERATGSACPICREHPADLPEVPNAEPEHLATAAYNLAAREALTAADLVVALERTAAMSVALETVETWSMDERKAVARWLALRELDRYPAVLVKMP